MSEFLSDVLHPQRARSSGRPSWWTAVGLVLVPLLIGGLLVWALWKPDERLDRIEAAVVNQDEPVTVDGQTVPLGRQLAAGLVTFAYDDLDWGDELRIFMEERASFSPDVMTGLEANLRFAGPETMETRIFGRLTAWQNWIFNRPNAVGESGALRRYGSGQRGAFDMRRV